MRRAEVQKSLLQSTQTTVNRLIERNVRAITANCGLFMWLHGLGIIDMAVDNAMESLNAAFDTPRFYRPYVALSSLTLLPGILLTLV